MSMVIETQTYTIKISPNANEHSISIVRSDGIEATCYKLNEVITVVEVLGGRGWWQQHQTQVRSLLEACFGETVC